MVPGKYEIFEEINDLYIRFGQTVDKENYYHIKDADLGRILWQVFPSIIHCRIPVDDPAKGSKVRKWGYKNISHIYPLNNDTNCLTWEKIRNFTPGQRWTKGVHIDTLCEWFYSSKEVINENSQRVFKNVRINNNLSLSIHIVNTAVPDQVLDDLGVKNLTNIAETYLVDFFSSVACLDHCKA